MSDKIINGGAFEGRGVGDFAGGTLPFKVRVEDSNWNRPEFLPTWEKQRGVNGDKLNCVTQSNHNAFEFQLNQMIESNTLPLDNLFWLDKNGYLDSEGKVNFSEKYNSILNLTSKYKGNWLYKVADDARKNGLIPQSMLPEKVDENWETYYAENQITQEMLELGKEFLEWFNISYEWIDDNSFRNLTRQLQHTPIQVVFPNHAVVQIRSKEDLMDYYDSYDPYVKEKAQNKITNYMKLVIDPIVHFPEDIRIIKDANSRAVGIWYAAKNPEELVAKAYAEGFRIPRKENGDLDWENFIQGTFSLGQKNAGGGYAPSFL